MGEKVIPPSVEVTKPAPLGPPLKVMTMLEPELEKRIASAAEATDELQEILATISQVGTTVHPTSSVQKRVVEDELDAASVVDGEESSTPTQAPAISSVDDVQFYVQVTYQGNIEEKVYPLGAQPVIVGRLTTSDIALDRPGQRYVSKRHCEILLRNDRVLIRDLGSTNGTVLGDQALQSNVFREWSADDQVLLGPFSLSLISNRELQSVPSPPVGSKIEPNAHMTVTMVRSAIKLSCPNAVPSRLPLSAEFPIIVGRGVDSDMVLDHPHVSKQHCRIQLGNNGVEVVDMRSTNGTFLGDQRLPPHTPVPWQNSPTIRIGKFFITLEQKS